MNCHFNEVKGENLNSSFMLVVKYLFYHNFFKALSGWIYFIPTIITTCDETCIVLHNTQLHSCYDLRGRAWVNTVVVKSLAVLLFVSCFPNK